MSDRKKDIAGERFGLLTAITRVGADKHKRSVWRCRCECGGSVDVMIGNLTSGNTTSCGCQKNRTTHGLRHTRAYSSWTHMQARCTDTSNLNYGGRGIVVCERWRSFEVFLEDMGQPPEGMTLDRIDVNGNYEPANCRWATIKQQNNNCRRTRYVVYQGERIPLAIMAKACGISTATLHQRIANLGWSVEKAVSTPVMGNKP
jgi:hypothetical protein